MTKICSYLWILLMMTSMAACKKEVSLNVTNKSAGPLELGQPISTLSNFLEPSYLDTVISKDNHEKFIFVMDNGKRELRLVYYEGDDQLKEIWVYSDKYLFDNSLQVGNSYQKFLGKGYTTLRLEKWSTSTTTTVEEYPNLTFYFENKLDSAGELSLDSKMKCIRILP